MKLSYAAALASAVLAGTAPSARADYYQSQPAWGHRDIDVSWLGYRYYYSSEHPVGTSFELKGDGQINSASFHTRAPQHLTTSDLFATWSVRSFENGQLGNVVAAGQSSVTGLKEYASIETYYWMDSEGMQYEDPASEYWASFRMPQLTLATNTTYYMFCDFQIDNGPYSANNIYSFEPTAYGNSQAYSIEPWDGGYIALQGRQQFKLGQNLVPTPTTIAPALLAMGAVATRRRR